MYIESIEIKEPTLLNGKYGIHGSGDFETWFPRDGKRPSRDKIFIINLNNIRINFIFSACRRTGNFQRADWGNKQDPVMVFFEVHWTSCRPVLHCEHEGVRPTIKK